MKKVRPVVARSAREPAKVLGLAPAMAWSLATLGLADSVSRVLTNGRGVFHGLGTTGVGFRQILAFGFALAGVACAARFYRAKFQTQGYLDVCLWERRITRAQLRIRMASSAPLLEYVRRAHK